MSTRATDVLNKTWTYDSEDDDIENISPHDDQKFDHRISPKASKLNLNATQVIIEKSNKMNITTNLNCGTVDNTSEINVYNKSSKFSSLPIIISTNSNQFAKASNEIKNFMERFCGNECYESLFDEKLEIIDLENYDLSSVTSVLTVNSNTLENNAHNIPIKDDVSPLDNDMIVDKFEDAINPASDSVPFNSAHVPETFDLFMNNLKNKISNINTVDDSNKEEFKLPSSKLAYSMKGVNNNLFNNNLRLSLSTRMLTSSVDKDLNNEDLFNPSVVTNKSHNRMSNVKANDLLKKKQIIAAKNNDFKTSSPFKSKVLNTTVEIKFDEKNTNMTCETDIGDSMRLDNTDGDHRVVFNTTYTSWSTNEQQLQIDAFNQKGSFRRQANIENKALTNMTFNKTKVILSDDEAMEGVEESEMKLDLNRTREIFTSKKNPGTSSTSSSVSSASSMASSTSSLATNRALNTTRDIDDNGGESKKKSSPVIAKNDKIRYSSHAKPNLNANVNNKIGLKQPMVSNNTNGVANKITTASKLTPPSKIAPPPPSIVSQSNERVQSSQSKFPSPTTSTLTKSSSQLQFQTKMRQPLTSTSTNNVVSPTLSSNNSVFKVPSFGFQKPAVTSSTTALKKPSVTTVKQNDSKKKESNEDGNVVNLNRLSMASMTSSVSSTSSSSSSSKENNSLKLKSPTNVKYPVNTINQTNNLNKIKVSTVFSSQASSTVAPSLQMTNNSTGQSNTITTPKLTSNLPVPQRSQLKAPSQIPTFKVPLLKNTNNVMKVN